LEKLGKTWKNLVNLGVSYRCLALFTPVLKGFTSNSQARGKDSPCPEKGQIPCPQKASKRPLRHARLITAESAGFYAQKTSISFRLTKTNQNQSELIKADQYKIRL
jgi:hypothetical protein